MTHRMLIEAVSGPEDATISGSPDEVRAIAQQGFADGIRMAAAIIEDPLTKAKLWALLRGAPNPSPTVI